MTTMRIRRDDGTAAVEYALMLACILVIISTAVGLLGTTVVGLFASAAALI